MDYLKWSSIPQHILVNIFGYLPLNDRLQASLVCKSWSDCFHHPQLWSKFIFKFNTGTDNEKKAITCIEKYCDVLKDVSIYINQSEKINRDLACLVMDELTAQTKKMLQKFSFHFTGVNPLCFNGNAILDKLKKLFSRQVDSEVVFDLIYVDLNHCNIAFDNDLLSVFAKQHTKLKVLHIQNSCLIDNITPSGMLNLVNNCPSLEELHTFYHCVDISVIEALATGERASFKELSLMCNRSDKYNSLILTDAWTKLTEANSDIEVSLNFHSSFPHHIIIPLLCPGIPLVSIDLRVYGWLTDELAHIAATFASTLQYLSFNPSLDHTLKAPPGMEPCLIGLVSECDKLEELHCYCSLSNEVIETIKAKGTLKRYTLYCS